MATLIVSFSDFAKALLRIPLTVFKSFALFSPSKASSPAKTTLILCNEGALCFLSYTNHTFKNDLHGLQSSKG